MKPDNQKTLLKSSEICSIIKACSEAGVSELKFAGLHLRFEPQYKPFEDTSYFPHPTEEAISDQSQQIEKESLESDEQRVKQERLDQMLIENPSAFEDLLLSGDLTDGQ